MPKGFTLLNDLILKKGMIVIVPKSSFRAKVLQYIHVNLQARHSGYLKTYQRAKKDMKKDIKQLIQECDVYQISKNEIVPPAGLLQPLPIRQQAWKAISMDFIEDLILSQGHNMIFVVTNKFTKYEHFMALSHPYHVQNVAQVFFDGVFKLDDLPKSIVSDMNHVFLSSF